MAPHKHLKLIIQIPPFFLADMVFQTRPRHSFYGFHGFSKWEASFFVFQFFNHLVQKNQAAPRFEQPTSRSNTWWIRPQDHGVLFSFFKNLLSLKTIVSFFVSIYNFGPMGKLKDLFKMEFCPVKIVKQPSCFSFEKIKFSKMFKQQFSDLRFLLDWVLKYLRPNRSIRPNPEGRINRKPYSQK